MPGPTARPTDNPKLAVALILLAMFGITVNDMTIKHLSGDYPLHQMVFVRSAIGIGFSVVFLQFEGGFASLRTRQGGLHLLRGLFIVGANMSFFAALASIPLADATALFFVAPLFITLLSIPFLGEQVGVRRLGAVVVGFGGVLLMLRPGAGETADAPDRWTLLLPVLAAFLYAGMQILTRRLGVTSTASAMSIYNQATFIAVSFIFFLVAGDGRYAVGQDSPSMIFLLREWVWPAPGDWPAFMLLGVLSAVVGYTLSQAYRLGDAAAIAPFEYTALPLAVFWGWAIFGNLPGMWVVSGMALIAGSGVYVFIREKQRAKPVASRRPTRRY